MDLTKHRISLDIHRQTTQAHLAVKKGDTARQVVASLVGGGVPYSIAEGCYAVFMAKKSDGTILYNDCAIEGNQIVYTFTEQTASSAGLMACELRLYGSDGNLITSPRIAIIVSGTVYEDSEVESTSEYSALSALVAETQALRDKFPEALTINGQVYDGSEAVEVELGPLVVTFDWDGVLADRELPELLTAHQAGRAVYFRWEGYLLPTVSAGESHWIFSGLCDNTERRIVLGLNGDGYTAVTEQVSRELAGMADIPAVEPMYVTVSEEAVGEFMAFAQYAEIRAARDAGRSVICLFSENGVGAVAKMLPLVIDDGTTFVFEAVVNESCWSVTIDADGNVSGGRAEMTPGPLYVTVTASGAEYVSDKTYAEIRAAKDAGQSVHCLLLENTLPLVADDGGGFAFGAIINRTSWYVSIGEDNSVSAGSPTLITSVPNKLPNPYALTINGQTYDGSKAVALDTTAFYVSVNGSAAGGYTSDKTVDEIDNAYQAGRQLYCQYGGGYLPLRSLFGSVAAGVWGYTFSDVLFGNEYRVNIGTNGVTVSTTALAYKSDIPSALPNPQALTINGTAYDGSGAVELEVPTVETVERLSEDVAALGVERRYVTNLFDKDSADNVDGYLLDRTPAAVDGLSYSHLIPVEPGKTYWFTYDNAFTDYYAALFYRADGTYFTRTDNGSTPAVGGYRMYTIPESYSAISYMRVSYSTARVDSVMVAEGAVPPPEYVPCGEIRLYFEYGKAWTGRKWICIGDSITEANDKASMHYMDYVAEKTGILAVNMGISGTGYKSRESSTDYGDAFYQRVQSVPTDADVITIFGSGNDLYINAELGEVTDTGTDTLCGCINTTLDNLFARIPTARVGLVTPTPWQEFNPADTGNAMDLYSNAIVEICRRRSIPCLDLYHCSGLRPWEETFRAAAYSKDGGAGCHPDETGHAIIAPRFKAFLDSLII